MIKVSVNYPATEGASFDHDYYKNSHVPLAQEIWSPAKAEIDKGLPGQPNVAAVHFYFESMDAFQAAMGSPRAGELMADVANYTTIAPTMQISEVVG